MVKKEFDKSALLIVNPVSGKKTVFKYLPQIIRRFMDEGYIVTTMVTGGHGDAEEFITRFGSRHDLICCTGGDGTLNQTLSGLAKAGLDLPLGYIPCGSTNDFAIAHGLSSDIMQAAENILSSGFNCYDIGRFGDKYFSYVAAFGAFSWLSYTTDQNLKNLLGHTAYILDGIKDLPKVKPYRVKLTADGKVHEGEYIFGAICNTTSIAGTIELPASLVDTCDGMFEVLLIKSPKNISEFELTLRGLIMQDYSCPNIDFFRARNIHIENAPSLEWALDGEESGQFKEADVSVMPGFLKLLG